MKPQGFDAARQLGELSQPTLIISVMAASRRIGFAKRWIRWPGCSRDAEHRSIRVGVSAIARGVGSTRPVDEATRLMSTVGSVVTIDEASMHAVTATSGSGPAHFLLASLDRRRHRGRSVARSRQQAGDRDDSRLRGTAQAECGSDTPQKMVTSPGGPRQPASGAGRARDNGSSTRGSGRPGAEHRAWTRGHLIGTEGAVRNMSTSHLML